MKLYNIIVFTTQSMQLYTESGSASKCCVYLLPGSPYSQFHFHSSDSDDNIVEVNTYTWRPSEDTTSYVALNKRSLSWPKLRLLSYRSN